VNFRNFKDLDVSVSRNVVIVGENGVGKSNLLYACGCYPTLRPLTARGSPVSRTPGRPQEAGLKDKIVVSVEINDFEYNLGVLAELTDFGLDH
jgi:putative ATP-dependent endonuclease of OLD family